MNSKKRKISAILSAFAIFNSCGFAAEKSDASLNKKILAENRNVEHSNNVRSKSADDSNLRWKLFTSFLGTTTLFELVGMYKQYKDNEETIENNRKTYNITLNALKKALNEAKKDIEDRDKKIEALKPQSHAFSLLKQKYTFKHQLNHGRQGSTAVFFDKDDKYVVVKTLFKSGSNADLSEIQKEKKAVEFLKNKQKNAHIVFPIEYFEDAHFLFVVYPYVPYVENGGKKGFCAPYLLNNFRAIINEYKEQFDKWNPNKKKKLIWYIAKQLFEVYKYFYDNRFRHDDLQTNVLVQLKKENDLDYNDFTIKIIDWGRWLPMNCKIRIDEDHPYQPMMPNFKDEYQVNIRQNFLYPLYKQMKFDLTPHEHKLDCSEKACCRCAFFSGLDKFFGCDVCNFCPSLPGYFRSGDNDKKDYKWVYEEWVKTFKFAQNFDDLIDFCQQQIDKL